MEDVLESLIDYRGKTPLKSETGIMTLSAKSVRNGYIDYSRCYYISYNEYKKFMVRGFPKIGDVLLTTEAPLGMVARLDRDNVAIAQRLLTLRGKEGSLDTGYLYYYLKSDIGQAKLREKETGTTVTGIKQAEFRKILIDIPDIDVQKKITAILSPLDYKIELNRRINANLEQQAQAIFKHMFSEVLYGNRAIEEYIIPKRGQSLLSKNAVPGKFPVVSGGLEASTYHNSANTKAPVLTISASGANAGFINLWYVPVWSSDSSFIDSKMTEHVYFWYLMLKTRQQEIYRARVGSVQPHIYPQHIAAMPTGDINIQQVNNFTEKVTPLFKMIGLNQAENNTLAQIRDSLLPKLISGEFEL